MCEILSGVADWISLKGLTDVNNPKVLSAPLFNTRQEPPSASPARNGLHFAWWGAQLNLMAAPNPTEDKKAPHKLLSLEVWWQLQKVSQA